MDTAFNLTNSHTGTINGYTRTQRVAITGAETVNLKEKIIKKILSPVLTTQLKVVSCFLTPRNCFQTK